MRRQARRLERLYQRIKLYLSTEKTGIQFVCLLYDHHRACERELAYWEAKIIRFVKDQKRLWATFRGILGRQS